MMSYKTIFIATIVAGLIQQNLVADYKKYQKSRVEKSNAKWIAAGAFGALAVGTTVAVFVKKTPKAVLCNRVDDFKRLFVDYDVEQLVNQLRKTRTIDQACCVLNNHAGTVDFVYSMRKEIFELHKEISTRYDSWIRFWNHSANMKEARPEIEKIYRDTMVIYLMVSYFEVYAQLVEVQDDKAEFESLVRSFTDKNTQFPLVDAVAKIESDKAVVDIWIKKRPEFKVLRNVQQDLKNLIQKIRQCSDYANELRHQEQLRIERERLEQERLRVQAEQERVRLDRERLEIDREKLSLDRQRLQQERKNQQPYFA